MNTKYISGNREDFAADRQAVMAVFLPYIAEFLAYGPDDIIHEYVADVLESDEDSAILALYALVEMRIHTPTFHRKIWFYHGEFQKFWVNLRSVVGATYTEFDIKNGGEGVVKIKRYALVPKFVAEDHAEWLKHRALYCINFANSMLGSKKVERMFDAYHSKKLSWFLERYSS